MNQILLTFIFLIGIGVLLIITEAIYRKYRLKGELTRKFAHCVSTLTTLSFPFLFTSHWYVFILVVIFFAILFLSRKGASLASIHDITRRSTGSYLLPIGIYLPFLISCKLENDLLFILPILVLAISDPFAGLIGMYGWKNNYKIKIFGNELDKTRNGTLAFLISCFVICVVVLLLYNSEFNVNIIFIAVATAMVSTFVELLSTKGTDNLFVPMSVLLMLLLFV